MANQGRDIIFRLLDDIHGEILTYNLYANYLSMIESLVEHEEIYPTYRDFFPFMLCSFAQVEKKFPHLRTIRLLLQSNDEIPWSCLGKYQEIILYLRDDLYHPEEKILIPLDLENRAMILQ